MDRKFLFALLAIGIVLVSGCISGEIPAGGNGTGAPGRQCTGDEADIMICSQEWLATPEGQEAYPNGILDEYVVIYNENKEAYLWIVPVMNQNYLYIGYILYDKGVFTIPKSYTQYGEPVNSVYSLTKDDAYSMFIVDNPSHLPEQIKEPILISREGEGLYWMSEVVINSEIVDTLYEKIFI